MGNGGREEWGEKREMESWAPYTLGEKRQESDSRSPDTKCQERQGLCECWKDPSGKQCHCLSVHLVRVLPASVGCTPHPRTLVCGPSPCGVSWLESGAQPRSPGFLEVCVAPWTAPSLTPARGPLTWDNGCHRGQGVILPPRGHLAVVVTTVGWEELRAFSGPRPL